MTKTNKQILLGLLVLPIAVLLILWLARREGGPRTPPFQRSDASYLAMWRSVPLTPISKSAAFREKVSQIPIESDHTLTQVQTNSLRSVAYDFLIAYSSGTFDDYARFRFPIAKGNYNPKLLQFDLDLLAKHGVRLDAPIDPLEVFAARWQGGYWRMCTNCWESAGVKDARLVLKRSSFLPDLRAVTDLVIYCPPADTSSLRGYQPRFLFDPSPKDVLRRDGTITHAFLWVIIRDRNDKQPYPVFCQWYWAEESGRWLPSVVGIGDVRDKNYSLLF